MLTMNAVLRTPIGDLVLIACEQGLVAIEFTEVNDDKNLELSQLKLHDIIKVPSSRESQAGQDVTAIDAQPTQLLLPVSANGINACKIIQQPSAQTTSHTTHEFIVKTSEVLSQGLTQLTEYFEKGRREFNLPLAASSTQFQQQVWQQLLQIPYGKFCSYGEIASSIARPKAVRAVGAANGRNPLAIVVPCHRVIGQNGSMTGYAGGLARKIWLLAHEQNTNLR